MSEIPKPHFESDEDFEKDLSRLNEVATVLRSLGFKVADVFLTREVFSRNREAGTAFPIVRDGGDGIRVSPIRKGGLKVWFTNSFEDLDNPRRLEVEKKLKEQGLWD